MFLLKKMNLSTVNLDLLLLMLFLHSCKECEIFG
jgi:hypothetical protein